MYEKSFNGTITCHISFGTCIGQPKYKIMKEGTKTIYQLEVTPYSSCRVVFVDKFGIRWGIMTEQTER